MRPSPLFVVSLVASLSLGAGVARAEAPWTIAPTFGGGYAWTDGERDYAGDESYPPFLGCEGYATPREAPIGECHLVVLHPNWGVAPTFSVGVLATHVLRARLVWTASLAVAAGTTHRFTHDQPNAGPTFVVRDDHMDIFTPDIRLGARVGSTLRVRLGGRMRGFLGAGAAVGVVADVARTRDGSVPFPLSGINPDATIVPFHNDRPPTRGFTVEALLEAGVVLAPRHLSLSLLLAAGRPLVRGEVVVAVPFDVGH